MFQKKPKIDSLSDIIKTSELLAKSFDNDNDKLYSGQVSNKTIEKTVNKKKSNTIKKTVDLYDDNVPWIF